MRALLAFFTALPVSGSSLEDAARKVYLLPLVGVAVGLPGALILLADTLPPGVAATLALGVVLLAAGLHHADGVLDVGDALMVQGSPERRREVLKDARVGIGGLFALFLVYAPSLAALVALVDSSPVRAALALLAGETAARSVMLLLVVFGSPASPDSSATPFVRALKAGKGRAAALAFAFTLPPLVALPLGWVALLVALLAVPVVALSALWTANRTFGGIGGDLSGATGELTRAVLLVGLSGLL